MTRMRGLAAAILVLALLALGFSLWLAYHAIVAGPIAGCTDSSIIACDAVLSSRWSTWFGIPVGILAVLNYVLLTGAAAWLVVRPDEWHRVRMILIGEFWPVRTRCLALG